MVLQQLGKKVTHLIDLQRRRILIEQRRRTQPDVIELAGIKLPIGDHLSQGMREALYGEYYEQSEISILKNQLRPEDIVMEIGTCLGFLASYCAKTIGSDRVFSYEGNPALEAHIRHTYHLNQVNPTQSMCLIGEHHGEATFYIGPSLWSASIIQRDARFQPTQVPVKSFNQELERINPSFLIVDIEGGEYEFMQYARFNSVTKILMELHERVLGQEKIAAVKSQLLAAGFQIDPSQSDPDIIFLTR
ncbi:hypothetical protein BST81_11810 [Leptolyngbya sp. 'hensonii']|uniref:FkbM family methyltransferase n=1 Tax=Leptolyngbya sp. 'hensonii' TaxID=1922337 RepID=UPI00094FE440|nr:FkbM family methyltransferase [Leptolyngbya sp. 'hensonii']OLP18237.1 hypothetical protein BST81_11810 [Leptolyngbya sp. 'hensonii']